VRMVGQARCPNWNHGRATSVTVRYCSMCGEVVNKNIPAKKKCSIEAHARSRRNQSEYCVDCGEKLFQRR